MESQINLKQQELRELEFLREERQWEKWIAGLRENPTQEQREGEESQNPHSSHSSELLYCGVTD
jgi:hypothetical protein